jgi:hypothetical protein
MSRVRDVILRRRSLFVGSALTALTGCPREPASDTPVVDVPIEGSADAMPDPEGRVVKEEPPEKTDELPPLDVPPEAEGPAQQMFERLAQTIPRIHDRLRNIEKSIPHDCKFDQPSCVSRWDKLIGELNDVDRDIENILPLCPGSSEQAQRYYERARMHHEFARKRRATIDESIARELARGGKSYEARLMELKIKTSRVTMRPCLSCIDW